MKTRSFAQDKLQSHAIKEWREAYLDFPAVKDLIDRAAQGSRQAGQSRKIRVSYPPVDHLNEEERAIFDTLERELQRTVSFYQELLRSAVRRLNVLRRQIEELEQHRDVYLAARRREIPAIRPFLRLMKEARQRMRPETPYGNHDSYEQDPLGYGTAYRKLQVAATEYYLFLDSIEQYCSVSVAAFTRALGDVEQDLQITCHAAYARKEEMLTLSVPAALFDLRSSIELIYEETFAQDSEMDGRDKLRSIADAPPSHAFAIWRTGWYLGVALVACALTGLQLFHGTARQRLPQYSTILQVYAIAGVPLLLALGVGVNWVAWRRVGVNVDVLFELDRQNTLDLDQYHEMPAFLICTLAITVWATFATEAPGVSPGYYILLWFAFVAVFLFNPFPIFHYHARWWICRTLIRVTMSGILQVEFRDLWLGDQLCSLSYSLSNIYLIGCAYSKSFAPNIQGSCDTSATWLTPMIGCLPSLFRLGHSARRYNTSPEVKTHLLNVARYGLSVAQLFCYYNWRIAGSERDSTMAVFIAVSAVNSLVQYAWDVRIDWNLFNRQSRHPFLRSELAYKAPAYYLAVIADFALRFAWLIYLSSCPLTSLLSFTNAMAEAFRRWIWNFFRVEAENSGNIDDFRVTRAIPLPYSIGDGVDVKTEASRLLEASRR